MRQSFEQTIKKLNPIARAEMAKEIKPQKDTTEKQPKPAPEEALEKLKAMAEKRCASTESWEYIYDLQRQKQRIVQEAEQRILNLDNPKFFAEKDPRTRLVTRENEKYYCHIEGENDEIEKTEIKPSEMLTDPYWGNRYHLDPHVIPRKLRGKYFIEEAKSRLTLLTEKQIIADELTNKAKGGPDKKEREGYGFLKKNLYKKAKVVFKYLPAGILAELMATNFIRKKALAIEYDNENAPEDSPFNVFDADPHYDIRRKTDLIVSYKNRRTGVQLTLAPEDPEKKKKVEDASKYLYKRIPQPPLRYVAEHPFDSIVFVSLTKIQPKEYKETYEKWVKEGRRPGGPDKLWSSDTQKYIFKGIMKDIMPPEEIERHC